VLPLFWRNVVPQAARDIGYNQKKPAKLRTITRDSKEERALARAQPALQPFAADPRTCLAPAHAAVLAFTRNYGGLTDQKIILLVEDNPDDEALTLRSAQEEQHAQQGGHRTRWGRSAGVSLRHRSVCRSLA
jgi:hypothetical protein